MSNAADRLTDALADRYRLERELGQGGMATVYLAQDLRHDRRVAVKVLRPELAAVIGAERFLSEIKTTANLQHPHILPLFDSGEADGFLFYVMPFVEGETVRDRMNREKQLPVADAVRIATEVAAALDYAHRHNVIHRDIKPENILLHDGRALVADFGIALAASKAGGTRMTETGMSLGTPHYMSPEQAMGEREITARSDVYALGCVLYEMLTGDPPFTGSTAQAIVARVVTESPRPMLPAAAHHPAARRGGGADRARRSFRPTASRPRRNSPRRWPTRGMPRASAVATAPAGRPSCAGSRPWHPGRSPAWRWWPASVIGARGPGPGDAGPSAAPLDSHSDGNPAGRDPAVAGRKCAGLHQRSGESILPLRTPPRWAAAATTRGDGRRSPRSASPPTDRRSPTSAATGEPRQGADQRRRIDCHPGRGRGRTHRQSSSPGRTGSWWSARGRSPRSLPMARCTGSRNPIPRRAITRRLPSSRCCRTGGSSSATGAPRLTDRSWRSTRPRGSGR